MRAPSNPTFTLGNARYGARDWLLPVREPSAAFALRLLTLRAASIAPMIPIANAPATPGTRYGRSLFVRSTCPGGQTPFTGSERHCTATRFTETPSATAAAAAPRYTMPAPV